MPMNLINTGPEPFFEDVVNHMAAICKTPIGIVALLHADRQWINREDHETGVEVSQTRSYCARKVMGPEKAVVERADTCACDVLKPDCASLRPRSWIAEPLFIEGFQIGTLYVADILPRIWTAFELSYMARSARLVANHFAARAALAERDRRIELEKRLAEASELYRAVITSMREGVLIQGSDFRMIACNPAALEIFGMTESRLREYTAHPEKTRIYDEDGAFIPVDRHPSQIALRTGRPVEDFVLMLRRGDGKARWIETNCIPLPTPDGSPPQVVVSTFSDISERRDHEIELYQARKDAEAANEAKSAFLANMSHEIRTPLNGVLGMAQVLQVSSLDPEQKDMVSTILSSGGTLMSLLNDVLDLSKIEAGRFTVSPVETNLHELLRNILKLWKPTADDKGLDLRLSFDAQLPGMVCIDPVRVQQCISNLVSNAIKFTREGSVTVLARAGAVAAGVRMIEIEVADTGPGMDKPTLARLFRPFAQADETISRTHGGSGLGLSITRRLAELMGGETRVASEPGRGSTFSLSFRAGEVSSDSSARVHRSTSPGIRPPVSLSGMTVLLVDDHPVNRKVASLFLTPYGVNIVEAENGVEALIALDQEPFDVVLLDMHMPFMDGPTAIKAIRSSGKPYANVPVIALTADAMSGDRERYLALGMNDYLSKPLAERDLLATLAKLTSATRRAA